MSEPTGGPLAGRRVLIVEDRYLIASELADDVRGLGAEVVGPAPDPAQAAELVERQAVDLALLDVNLGGELVFPLAEQLADRGVKLIFMTGYDNELLPERWRARPTLAKPIDARELRAELTKAAALPI